MNSTGVKRLIEVDLPIRDISTHARREKSIRHGHISTLHIWWARRPLAACRAVLCAALWPDPADEACPQSFRDAAALVLASFAEQVRNDRKLAELSAKHWQRWNRTNLTSLRPKDPAAWGDMRYALFDFIADFANWDASTVPGFLDTARLLTHAAHLSLTLDDFKVSSDQSAGLQASVESLKAQMEPLPRPLVVDPFAGGGSIPLEALRVGADAFASDLNPVAVLLNKVVLEYIPKYGNQKIEIMDESGKPVTLNGLAEAVRYWGNWIKEQAEKELAEFYPKDPDGATPIAYLWARTMICEGPNCGAEVPLMRSFWLAKKANRNVAIQLVPDKKNKTIGLKIAENVKPSQVGEGTVRRGSTTCPVCNFTTPLDNVREQLRKKHGGTDTSKLIAVVLSHPIKGTVYRLPNEADYLAIKSSGNKLKSQFPYTMPDGSIIDIPTEPTPTNKSHRAVGSPWIYGMTEWGNLFTIRQNLALLIISKYIRLLPSEVPLEVKVILGFCVSKLSGFLSSLCMWRTTRTCVAQTFSRQALPQVWDFGEMNPFAGSAGDWSEAVRYVIQFIENIQASINQSGIGEKANAISSPLPDDSSNIFFTDPPYYDSVAYAELSDFFYVWLKRSIGPNSGSLFADGLTPKNEQAIVLHPNSIIERNSFESKMSDAMSEGRRVLQPNGIGVVVFAHKSTAGWESQLQSMMNAGWVVTGSWPIDTERGGRVNAHDTASLASSIHLVCRPRESVDGSLVDSVGDWRDVLSELPTRIRSWLPRLAAEGVVGADAIFACLGPALEIYSRYSRVETASGEQVSLKQYLEVVWAAVAREALGMIFEGADATGFEEDARLTAIWLWTLKAEASEEKNENIEPDDEDAEPKTRTLIVGGYALEYDAARKIAQGLGAHLEKMTSLAQVKGDQARLLSVRERSGYLFGREDTNVLHSKGKSTVAQLDLFATLAENTESDSAGWDGEIVLEAGSTTLDRLHQAMLLFGVGRGEALRRFLVENGVGKDTRFWRLAQALSALYPSGSDEKRWVDGVLARKKGLGF